MTYVQHDFLKPQTITRARVYTLKSIIHDCSDDQALEMLRNVAHGMTPGCSKMWILEAIVPETKGAVAFA